MEYLILFGFVIIVGVMLLSSTSKKPFEKPEVSAISPDALAQFDRVSSLWVNASERLFFQTLARHMPPGFTAHGKVRLEDIIKVRKGVDRKTRWALRGRVKSRHVDYLIIDWSGRPILAIELDGSAHRSKKAAISDDVKTSLFAAAAIPLMRVQVGQDFGQIAATIGRDLTNH